MFLSHPEMQKKVEDSFCVYKLDLSKAYDRVEWEYMRGILLKFGFDERWVKQVMACVSSVRFTVKLNGEIT